MQKYANFAQGKVTLLKLGQPGLKLLLYVGVLNSTDEEVVHRPRTYTRAAMSSVDHLVIISPSWRVQRNNS